ncbi:MAG: transposase, partial [Spirochaetaceae bacterium]|nr:transposase [Spirochaetaceae bacterium]
MSRYSAQFRNTVLKKLLPPESRSALSLAKEYNLSVATIYGWKSKIRNGTLQVDEGVQANRSRQLSEKLSLLLESRSVDEETMGEWLRGNGLHSQHLSVWEQEVRDAV